MRYACAVLLAATCISACSRVDEPPAPGEAPPEAAAPEELPEEIVPLNLDREHVRFIAEESGGDLNDAPNTLPHLVDEKEQRRVRLSGKVLTDEEDRARLPSIDGGELKVEIQTP